MGRVSFDQTFRFELPNLKGNGKFHQTGTISLYSRLGTFAAFATSPLEGDIKSSQGLRKGRLVASLVVDLPQADSKNAKASDSQDDESEGRSRESTCSACGILNLICILLVPKKTGCDVNIWQPAPPRKITSQYRLWGAFPSTKNSGLNYRNFRMPNGTVNSTRPDRSRSIPAWEHLPPIFTGQNAEE